MHREWNEYGRLIYHLTVKFFFTDVAMLRARLGAGESYIEMHLPQRSMNRQAVPGGSSASPIVGDACFNSTCKISLPTFMDGGCRLHKIKMCPLNVMFWIQVLMLQITKV